jgi:hypothetical protein
VSDGFQLPKGAKVDMSRLALLTEDNDEANSVDPGTLDSKLRTLSLVGNGSKPKPIKEVQKPTQVKLYSAEVPPSHQVICMYKETPKLYIAVSKKCDVQCVLQR